MIYLPGAEGKLRLGLAPLLWTLGTRPRHARAQMRAWNLAFQLTLEPCLNFYLCWLRHLQTKVCLLQQGHGQGQVGEGLGCLEQIKEGKLGLGYFWTYVSYAFFEDWEVLFQKKFCLLSQKIDFFGFILWENPAWSPFRTETSSISQPIVRGFCPFQSEHQASRFSGLSKEPNITQQGHCMKPW